MARVPTKHDRDEALGFLNNLQDWEHSVKDKEKKIKAQDSNKDISVSSSKKTKGVGKERKSATESRKDEHFSSSTPYDYSSRFDTINSFSSSYVSNADFSEAALEKDQGNEYFKQKKFKEAIDCYSRSIVLSPTAVAYANRAMAYLKLRKFQEADDDCTEALNMDDRYIKAYSRRATARKELGKLKECIEDAEFALRLEPHNQEIKKQYTEAKASYEKSVLQKTSIALENTIQKMKKPEKSDTTVKSQIIQPIQSVTQETKAGEPQERSKIKQGAKKQELKASVQELSSRAASLAMNGTARIISPPNSAYQFETSWRGFSGNRALQTSFLKSISPGSLSQIFKNALTVPILVDIVKCVATFFGEDMDLAVSILENLTKVPRFGILVMCVTSGDREDLGRIWNEIFSGGAIPIDYAERLDNLRAKYDDK